MEKQKEVNHAESNARGWSSTIAELVAALDCDYDRRDELREERKDLVKAQDEANAGTLEERTAAAQALADWDRENGEELNELNEAGGEFDSQDEARTRIEESPLSVQVRSGWADPGAKMEAEDFEVLLTTGGPALRIVGELAQGEPSRAWLEYQDWGTGWTEFHGEGRPDSDTLLTFCRTFYFGE